jgi:hypothetical protein
MVHPQQQEGNTGRAPQPQPDRPPQVPPDRRDLPLAACLALASFGVYLVTLAPGLLPADSGEFQTLAVTLGYSHPTGSPVYLLLARLAATLPLGDVAYRVNLLSAVMGAAAVGLLYLLGRSLVRRRWICVAGGAALAVSPTFWSQAIVAELYSTQFAFLVAILLLVSLWQGAGRWGWLFAACFLEGVGLGVHASVLLVAPALLVLDVLAPRRWKTDGAAAVSGTLLGLTVLLAAFAAIDRADSPACYFRTVVLPSRSLWNLEPQDLDDFHDRVRLSLSGPQCRDHLLASPPQLIRLKTAEYLSNLPRELPPLWLALAAAGLFWLGRKAWKMTLFLGLVYGTYLLFNLRYETADLHVLHVATYVPAAIFGVAGLALVADGWTALGRRLGRHPLSSDALDAALAILGLVVVVSPLFSSAAWSADGRRRCWVPPEEEPLRVEHSALFHQEIRQLVTGLEDDAVLFVGWSRLYPCYYVAHLEQGRTQMVFIQDYPRPYHFELADSALEYVEEVAPTRPVYFTHVVAKVENVLPLEPVHCGREILYRVGRPIPPAEPTSADRSAGSLPPGRSSGPRRTP